MSFPTPKLEIAPGSLPSDKNPSWTDITGRLAGVHLKHGRPWELEQMQTGTATFTLDNRDRVLDPTYSFGPFAGQLLPYTQVRFSMGDTTTNLCTNGGFESNLTKWSLNASGGLVGAALSRATDWAAFGTTSARVTATQPNDSTSRAVGLIYATGTAGIPVTAGVSYTFSAYLNTIDPSFLVTGSNGYFLRFNWYQASGAASATATTQSAVFPDEGVNGRLAFTAIAPSDAAFCAPDIRLITATPNDVLDFRVDGVQVEAGLVALGYVETNGAAASSQTYRLFTGFVERFPLAYEGPDDATVDLECVDMFAALAQAQITGSFPEQQSGARITAVLSAAGWTTSAVLSGWTLGTSQLGTSSALGVATPTNVIDAGKATVAAVTFTAAQKQLALAHIQEVVDSEPGYFFFDGQGRAVFQDRSHVTPVPDASVLTFTDDPAAADATHVCYRDIVLSYDPDRIFNDVEVTVEDGSLATVSDSASVDRFWRRTLNRATHLRNVADAGQLAGFLLYLYGQAKLRADSVTVDPAPGDGWAPVLGREVGDHATVLRTPATHPVTTAETISQFSVIESVEHVGTPPTDWTTIFQVTPLPPVVSVWKLGTSQLGVDTRIVYV